MSTLRTVFVHSKPSKNKNKARVTIAGIINYDTREIKINGARNNVDFGETFHRKTGRQVAAGRAAKHPILTVSFSDPNENPLATFYKIANTLIKHPNRLNEKKKEESVEVVELESVTL